MEHRVEAHNQRISALVDSVKNHLAEHDGQ